MNSPLQRKSKNIAMEADPSLSNKIATSEVEIPKQSASASQMEDKNSLSSGDDRWKSSVDAYNDDYNFSISEYGENSIEEINNSLKYLDVEEGLNVDSKELFKEKGDDYKFLGDDYEFNKGNTRFTSKGTHKKVYQYGMVESTQQEDGSYKDIISITAKNHPLFGSTYERSRVKNKDFKSKQPISELNNLISNYSMQDGTDANSLRFDVYTNKKGKNTWGTDAKEFEKALKNGKLQNNDYTPLSSEQRNELVHEFKILYDRYKKPWVTSIKKK
jgi:hypothetical protein